MYATKTISTGEGGILVSKHKELIEHSLKYRNYGKFEHVIDGVRFASFVVIPITISMLYISKLLASEKSRFVLISNMISTGIFFIGFIILGPLFGIVGLVSVLLISSSVQALVVVIATKYIEKTPA